MPTELQNERIGAAIFAKRKKLVKVALDTNMLTAVGQLKIDIFQELKGKLGKVEFVIPEQVKKEIEKLAKKQGTRRFANVALQLCKKYGVKTVKIEANDADGALRELANRGYKIATNDRELRRRIGERVIFIRQRKFIVAE